MTLRRDLARSFRIAVSLVLVLTTLVGPNVPAAQAQVPAAVASLTMSAFFGEMRKTIRQIEESASSLIQGGNAALAQQQMMLAGVMKATIDRLETAYASSLDNTLSTFTVAEQQTFLGLRDTLNQAAHLEQKTADDMRSLIYQTQQAANQVLSTLPLTKVNPVFYGFQTRDLLALNPSSTADIEVLGFNLKNNLINKDPVFVVNGTPVPPTQVSVMQDRVHITLSEAQKKNLRLANTPCEPRSRFPLQMTVFSYKPNKILPHSWVTPKELPVTFHGQALPASRPVAIEVAVSGSTSVTSLAPQTYEVHSGQVNVGCEQGLPASANFAAPTGAVELNANCAWFNTDNLKSHTCTPAVGGLTATATGEARGRDKDWLGNCPGGGHGALRLFGSYQIPVTTTTPVDKQSAGTVTMRQPDLPVTVTLPPIAGFMLSKVDARIAYEGCPALLDTIEMNVAAGPVTVGRQQSQRGFYSAVLRQGEVEIAQMGQE
jgi:hypothetical protein